MKNKKILIPIFSILLILIVIIAIIVERNNNTSNSSINNKSITSPSPTPSAEPEFSNTYGNEIFNMVSCGDNFIKYNDWIIFSNGTTFMNYSSNIKDGIYKYNMKTGQLIKLYKYNGFCLNIKNDNLYFCTEHGNVYSVNLKSLADDWVSEIDGASYLSIYNNSIFYTNPNGNNVYKSTSLGGKLIAEYVEGAFQIYNDYIYYIDAQSHNLFKNSITNTKEESLNVINESIDEFYVKDNIIIYSNQTDKNVYVYNYITNTTETLCENTFSNFVLNNNKLYFYSDTKQALIEIDINTKEEIIILDNIENINRLQLFDNFIFYTRSKAKHPNVTTSLYYIDINNKKEEQLLFRTN